MNLKRKISVYDIIFIIAILFLYGFALVYGYSFHVIAYFILIVGISVIVFIYALIFTFQDDDINRRKIRGLIAIFTLGGFWTLQSIIYESSEYVYFKTHKFYFEKIVREFKENPEHAMKQYPVDGDTNFVAIGVKNILDNTDGFAYWEGNHKPSGVFEGNLTFTERIEGNWYKFSSR